MYPRIFIILILSITAITLNAQGFIIKENSGLQKIGKYVYVAENIPATATINNILSSQYNFILSKQSIPVYKSSSKIVWLKIPFTKTNSGNGVLEMNDPLIDSVQFYLTVDNKIAKTVLTGSNYKYSSRDFSYKDLLFLIPDSFSNKNTVIYLRMNVESSKQFSINMGTFKSFTSYAIKEYLLFGGFIGTLITVALYFAFFRIRFQEKSFKYYIAYLLLFAFSIAVFDGFAFEFFWPDHPFINNYIAIIPSLLLLASFQFSRLFLNLPVTGKRLDFIAKIFMCLATINLMLCLAGFECISLNIVQYISTLYLLYAIALGIHFLKKGFSPAGYFLIANCTLLICVLMYVLQNQGILPSNAFTSNGLKIGSLLEMLLLGLALVEKMHYFKIEYQQTIDKYKELEIKNKIMQENIESTVNSLLQEKTLEFKEIDDFKNKLISTISHDLKSPVNSVQMVLDVIDSNVISAEDTKLITTSIRRQVKSTMQMIDTVLIWSRNQLNGFQLHKKETDVCEVAESIFNLFENTLKEKKLDAIYTCSIQEKKIIDTEIFKIIFRNLLSNAIKFSYPCSEILVEIYDNDKELVLRITDHGTGIDSDTLALLFDLAHKHSTKGTASEPGSGLGLKLANEFAIKHGGNITAVSEPQKGSTFTAVLTCD